MRLHTCLIDFIVSSCKGMMIVETVALNNILCCCLDQFDANSLQLKLISIE